MARTNNLYSGAVQRSVYIIYHSMGFGVSVYKRKQRDDRDVYTDVLVFDWTTTSNYTGRASANRGPCVSSLVWIIG